MIFLENKNREHSNIQLSTTSLSYIGYHYYRYINLSIVIFNRSNPLAKPFTISIIGRLCNNNPYYTQDY